MTPANFDQARQYLARVIPWPEGQEHFVNVHWTFKPSDAKPGDKPKWSGRACRSVNEAANAIQWALGLPETLDVYACMSAQRQAEERTSKKGHKYYSAMRSREDAVSLKAIFIDIDFKGGEHGYDTPELAAQAFGKFLADTKMPGPSMVVKSGGGLHIYWIFSRALTPDEWDPLAFALAEATKRHGLKCDTQCTIDRARVLRVPDTFNRKQAEPRKVTLAGAAEFDYSVERIAQALEPYMVAVPRDPMALDPVLFPPRPPILENELSAGIEPQKAPRPDIKAVAAECGFIRDALANGGVTYTNPLWNLTTLIGAFCDDGRKAAHIMGRGHPGYSFDSTQELFDRKEREIEERNLGWPQCRTISGAGATMCQTCPHFQKGKSPLNFAAKPTLQLVALPAPPALPAPSTPVPNVTLPVTGNADLPKGYDREQDGTIVYLKPADAGAFDRIPFCNYLMQDAWLQKGPWAIHFMYAQTGQPNFAPVTLTFTELAQPADVRKRLFDQGMTLHGGEDKNVMEFIVSWIDKLRDAKNIVSTAPFGWNLDAGKLEGFVYGGKMWQLNGERLAPAPDPVTASQYSPVGDRQVWLDAAKLITDQGRPALEAILASAFAAPLVRFTGQPGLILSVYSMESGIGKTTALKVAQAVWGDPVRGIMGVDDTSNAFFRKMGELRSLPMYWDELKTEDDTRKFVNDVFKTSLGKEKSRLSARIQQREVGTWQTLLISASNESLVDFVASRTKMTTAGIYRIFEYQVPRGTQGQISPSQAQRTVAKCYDNYGNVGLEYAKFLGANFIAVDKVVEKAMRDLEEELDLKGDERFWGALVAALLCGAKYGNDLGFTTIDQPALKAFLVTMLGNMRGIRAAQPNDMRDQFNVVNVLQQFLTVMRARHTILTNRIHTGQGKPVSGSIVVKHASPYLDAVYVHIGIDDKLLRISSAALTNWLQECGLSRHLFTTALKEEFGSKIVDGRIAGGTQYASPMKEYLIETHLDHPALKQFVEL